MTRFNITRVSFDCIPLTFAFIMKSISAVCAAASFFHFFFESQLRIWSSRKGFCFAIGRHRIDSEMKAIIFLVFVFCYALKRLFVTVVWVTLCVGSFECETEFRFIMYQSILNGALFNCNIDGYFFLKKKISARLPQSMKNQTQTDRICSKMT